MTSSLHQVIESTSTMLGVQIRSARIYGNMPFHRGNSAKTSYFGEAFGNSKTSGGALVATRSNGVPNSVCPSTKPP